MKQWIWLMLLSGILVLGLGIRLYFLTDVPHGFFCDEADIAYNAYMLLHHGTDEYGKVFPLFFQSLGDYKDPIQIYSTVPFVAFFGLTEFASRFAGVMWGMLTVVGVYFLTKQIKHSQIAALSAALVAATMPWLVHYSRIGVEYSVYVATITWTLYFFFKSFERKIFFIPAFAALGITFYSYQPAKLLVPLILIGWILMYHHLLWRHRKIVAWGIFVFLILDIPMLVSFFDVAGTARFAQVSIFSARIPFNQTVVILLTNYFYQLSPAFFLKGDPTFITRHFVKGLLPLLPITLPFLILGVLQIIFTLKKASSQLFLWLLLMYPIGGALVASGPMTSRSFIGAPIFAILCGLGIDWVIRLSRDKIGKVLLGGIVVGLILINTGVFAKFYFTQYPLYSSDYWGWQYGAGPIMQYFLSHKNEYNDLVMVGDFNAPEVFLKFYDPLHACTGCQIGTPQGVFDPHRKQLFALAPDDMKKDPSFVYHTVGKIFYPDNTEAFAFVTVTKK